MLAKAILVHGVIGYKFCWLLPSEDHNQGAPAGHESNGTTVRDHWEDMNQLRHQLGMNQFRSCETSYEIFAAHFAQLYAVVFKQPELLRFNSNSCTVWRVGLLTSRASKGDIVCMKWTLGSTLNVSNSFHPLEFHVRFLSFSSLHSWLALAKNYKAPKLEFFR